jgi:hypothetical protein
MDVGRICEEFRFVAADEIASGMRDHLAWPAAHEF